MWSGLGLCFIAHDFTIFLLNKWAIAPVTQAIANPIPIPLKYMFPVKYDIDRNITLRTNSNIVSASIK